jgi:hypothetical protein
MNKYRFLKGFAGSMLAVMLAVVGVDASDASAQDGTRPAPPMGPANPDIKLKPIGGGNTDFKGIEVKVTRPDGSKPKSGSGSGSKSTPKSESSSGPAEDTSKK